MHANRSNVPLCRSRKPVFLLLQNAAAAFQTFQAATNALTEHQPSSIPRALSTFLSKRPPYQPKVRSSLSFLCHNCREVCQQLQFRCPILNNSDRVWEVQSRIIKWSDGLCIFVSGGHPFCADATRQFVNELNEVVCTALLGFYFSIFIMRPCRLRLCEQHSGQGLRPQRI